LDDHDIFLGFDWLMEHNPEINWKTGGIQFSRCPSQCKEMESFRRSNISMDIKITEHLAKESKEWKEIVPTAYHEFTKAFEEGQHQQNRRRLISSCKRSIDQKSRKVHPILSESKRCLIRTQKT
jgi:hypothetical protein